jgi:hypothetical protein
MPKIPPLHLIQAVFMVVFASGKDRRIPGRALHTRNADSFTFAWTALVNRSYTVQYCDGLSGTNWITLTNVTATTPVLTVTDTSAPAGTDRSCRAVLNP